MLGVGSYAVLEWLQHTHIASKSEPFFSLTTSLYAPMALAFFVTFAAFSAVHRVRRAKLVDQQTGLDSLRHTPWKDFEVLVAEAFRRQGYTADYSLDTGPDGGVDILLKKAGRTALVQCKRWKECRWEYPWCVRCLAFCMIARQTRCSSSPQVILPPMQWHLPKGNPSS
jgi:hypothetical protein